MRILKWLDNNAEKVVCAVLLTAMTIVITMQLILRWSGLPLGWTEEIARYCFVWLIYIACSYGVKERAHIKVDAIMLILKERGKFIIQMISNTLFFIFALVVTYNGIILLKHLAKLGQVSPAVQIPMIIPYASYIVGFSMVMIRLIQDTVLRIKEEKQRLQEIGKEDKEQWMQ